ncbi:hypothetical protein ASG87_18225 [Frateuria sp. Soil773]|uniref:ArnT family glycosyltransferase n=1 Tax=Frateuria sp. Soil773 TaxID=1736407 RepID=UPI0006FCDE81|nr:glycosyltransferase family 39 protein [Frateuria sp. Soil773]KRE93770.1 hypothetical protein ASG87_18225 [Frateuria sp. Soil773]
MTPSFGMGRHWPWLLPLLLLAALRLCWIDAYPLNSDEAQHAHVAWAWTQHGLMPYRDVFDNHGPLFGWLHSPLLALLDGRADVLAWLRLAMQAWYALALFATWLVGRRLYGPRVALAAVLVAGLFPHFFLVSGQFRTDDLWSAAWLAALAAVAGAPARAWRWFVAGLLAGAALAVSQKTLVLLVAALAAAATVRLARPVRTPLPLRHGLAGIAGLLLVPLLFALWLAAHGILGAAWYDIVGYNVDGAWKHDAAINLAAFLLLAAGLSAAAARLVRRRGSQPFDWEVFLALQAGIYLSLIWFVWPLITAQDFLPAIPPLLLACCGGIAGMPWLRGRDGLCRSLVVVAVAAELLSLFSRSPPWRDRLAAQRAELAQVLRYTDGSDTVMDAKGDAIFRMRPYYPVLESLARRRLKDGRMRDTIAAQLVSHRTMLVVLGRLPRADESFVEGNYLPAGGNLWIAGRLLPAGNGSRVVVVVQPGEYTLTDGATAVSASLDSGAPADHWFLKQGVHHIAVASGHAFALIWSKAWDRGWRPDMLPEKRP